MGWILKSVGALFPHYSGRKVRVVMPPAPLMSSFELLMRQMENVSCPFTKASNDAKVKGRRVLSLVRGQDYTIAGKGGTPSPIVFATLEGGDEVMLWIPVQN